MATATAHLTPEVLRWAREATGYTEAEAADGIGVYTWEIEQAEAGRMDLAYTKAEKLAQLYELPLATLFLPSPPVEESQEALFRRLPGAPPPPWAPAMHKLVRRMRDRQDAATELFDLLDDAAPWPGVATRLGADAAEFPARIRNVLGIELEEQQSWQDTRGHTALRAWVDAVETLGILVMQDGSLTLDEMRGFASLHANVPAIVLNTKDDPRARVFTLIHEFGHILRPQASEVWCNRFAGQLLMPTAELRQRFRALSGKSEDKLSDLARLFSLTPSAVAVGVANARLLHEHESRSLIGLVRSRQHAPTRPRRGDHYRNILTWRGPAFVRLVLTAADENAITLSNAAGLLGAKVDQFDRLRQLLEERSALS